MMPKIRLHLNPRTHGSGVQLKNSPIKRDQKKWEKGPEVFVSTLDTQIPMELHAKIQIIKIDVEGAELSVLQGATNILKLSKSKLIIESLEPSTTESIIKYLEPFSYKHTNTLSKNLIFTKL
jgi:FkbM family methyltransferase